MSARQERKVVTCLFCDLVGFTSHAESMDPEDVAAFLSRYHDRVRSELERHGGTVEKFIGDAVMAVFGAPVAHEDDPERAVRSALAIRDWAGERDDIQLRVGITTGEALVSVPPAQPNQGLAAGDVVNTASRLQSAARDGAILVDEGTRRATRDAIEYRAAEAVEAKGKADRIPVWEAIEARSRFGLDVVQEVRTPLVGREDELASLASAVARARRERSVQLVTLVGLPGIGKSRLVHELFRSVEDDADLIRWRQGRSLPYGEGVTFWALAEMVKAEAGILETDTGEEAARKLTAAVEAVIDEPRDAQWTVANLRPLVGLAAAGDSAGDRQAEAFAAWRRFLETLADDRPTVLVFEDLHWADDGLLDFVDHLVDWASDVPLVVVCTARLELLARRPGWGGGKPNAATISLSPLSGEETARLVHALLERAVLPANVQDALLERVAGNPLYAEEFVRMVAERPSGEAGSLALPETLQGAIAARLDALAPEEKSLLQDASVVGKVFWPAAMTALAGGSPFALEPALHGLERKQFVRRERRSAVAGETQYAFHHIVVRDTAYGQITRAERARKHLLAAEWIESLAPDRSQDRAEMLAHHYLAALDLAAHVGMDTASLAARAAPALRQAGDHALSLNAFAAAERFYASALDLLPADDPARPYVLFTKATAGAVLAPHDLEAVDEAIAGFLEQGDVESAAEAECFAAVGHWTSGRRAPADVHLERALSLVADAPPSSAKARVLAHVSRARMWSSDYSGCVSVGREALAMADALGLDEVRASLLNIIGTSRVCLGDADGLHDVRESVAIVTALNVPDAIHRSYHNLGECYRQLGRLADASATLAEERRSDERFGLERLLRDWVAGEEAVNAYLRGDWAIALERAEAVIRTAEEGAPGYMESATLLVRAAIRAARGADAGAESDSTRALALAREQQDPQALAPALALRAQLLAIWGRPAEASQLVDELFDIPPYYSAALPLAWAAVDLGRAGDVLRGPLSTTQTPWEQAAADIAAGRVAEAADRLAAMGAVADEAYVRLRSDDHADLRRALEFYRSVGATRYVREGETLLAASA